MKTPATAPVKGSENATDIYRAVGNALSWWESSEDQLMAFFKFLVGETEPIASETYTVGPRARRNEMLKSAMKHHAHKFADGEVKQVANAMKALDKLASKRNEIAHGFCSDTEVKHNGVVMMKGYYLVSSLHEGTWQERSIEYAYTAETLNQFIAAVRKPRGIIQDVYIAILQRDQESRQALPEEAQLIISLAKHIVKGTIPPESVTNQLKLVHPPVAPPFVQPSEPTEKPEQS